MRLKLLFVIPILLLFTSSDVVAQKKDFSYAQLFQGTVTDVSKPLPVITKWIDDEHYVEMKKDADGTTHMMSVEVKTGKAVPYQEKTPDGQIPAKDIGFPKEAKNITYSPNKKYAAYTLYNNLFVTETSTEKTTQITKDGNDSIMNGYASWVYYEEILGRATRYRAFWWSPDSRHLVFMHFDDSPVPVFPIYIATGQHG